MPEPVSPSQAQIDAAFQLAQRGDHAGLEACARLLTQHYPQHVLGWSLLGTALNQQGRPSEALPALTRALALMPGRPELHNAMGSCLNQLGRTADAEASFRQALGIQPGYLSATVNLALLLAQTDAATGQWVGAVENYQKALQLAPDRVTAIEGLAYALLQLGKADEAVACANHAVRLQPESQQLVGNLLFALNYAPHATPAQLQDALRQYGDLVHDGSVSRTSALAKPSGQPAPLRIGLVSGDFRRHSVAYFLSALLENCSPDRIEFHAFSTNVAEDEMTTHLRSLCASWVNIADLNDAKAAAEVEQRGIHILIDLAGHSGHNRLPLFAMRPAPIQVSWLGYIASTGVAGIDFVLSDVHASQRGDERFFAEAVWRMPNSCVCYAAPSQDIPVSTLPADKNGYVTFGSFNNLPKVNQHVCGTWAQILHAVPSSKLFLKNRQLSDEAVRNIVQEQFRQLGIEPDRLVLKGILPSTSGHLAEYHHVDIGLDTFPYPGVTTSVEALWMGVPVLTMRGTGQLLRMGESIAHNTQLAHWIANDADEYVNKAVQYTADLASLRAQRESLRSRLELSELLNSRQFSAAFENAMVNIWQHHIMSSAEVEISESANE